MPENLEKLTYEDLKLGELARDMFYQAKDEPEITGSSAFYLNTKEVIYGANVTDLAIAAVLGKVPLLLIGRPGCGKSQLASDFSRFYFNGTNKEGLAIEIDGTKKDLDIYEEIFTQLNREKLRRELSDRVDRCFADLEEFNRQSHYTQNQFLNLPMGRLTSPKGESIRIGKEGYFMVVATANMGNGEYMGTFEDDKALRDRFGVVLDFNYGMFQPTDEDLILIRKLSQAHPGVKQAPLKDLSGKIISASKEISRNTIDLGLETESVLWFLQFGLKNCIGDGNNVQKGIKEVSWPKSCQDCGRNSSDDALCSLIRETDGRTLQVLPQYVSALNYLINLKHPEKQIDATELTFKAFELTGAYQNFLNPFVLHQKYGGQAPEMMREVVDRLKEEYNKNKDRILSALESSKEFGNADDLFVVRYEDRRREMRRGYREVSEHKGKLSHQGIEIQPLVFSDAEEIGYSWVMNSAAVLGKINKTLNKRKKNKNQNKK